MEKERRIKVLSIIALIVAVLGLTVAFASLSKTLTINGTASVDAASWDIHFENLKEASYNGAEGVFDEPTLEGTTIKDIDLVVTKPNDYFAYNVDIKNSGTINAKISSVELSTLCTLESPVESCDWDNDGEVTEEDVNKVNENISFVILNDTGSQSELEVGTTLNAQESLPIVFGLLYGKTSISGDDIQIEESNELPKRSLQFNNLSITINFVQAD